MRTIVPAYFTEADHPWLRALLEERERFVGRKRADWQLRTNEPVPFAPARAKLATVLRVLDGAAKDQARSSVLPSKMRAALFREAANEPDCGCARVRAALALGISEQELMEGLFADLPGERAVMPLPEPLAPHQLALACNAQLVASLLAKALRVQLVAHGQVRAVVRHAKLMGLLCQVTPGASKDELALDISGPYALFRHTRIYGRALASLVPRLSWCRAYRLEADCVLGNEGSIGRLVLRSGDPIAPARELAPFDSQVEERFARAFARLALEWDLIREPRAIAAGSELIFPDFELCHRMTGERWMLEIVGYWTPEYLRRKLELLRRAQLERLILCIDEERCCSDESLAVSARVIRYRRKVDPRAVLAIVDPGALERRELSQTKTPARAPKKPR